MAKPTGPIIPGLPEKVERNERFTIPIRARADRFGNEFFIVERSYSRIIDLSDWFMLVFLPPEGSDEGGQMVFERRREFTEGNSNPQDNRD
jgi:hypothetical protein